MKRKIIKQGDRCFTVTLPIKWVRENGLGAGKELEVAERGCKLMIQASQEYVEQEVEIKSDDFENLKSQVISSYLSGVDKITVYCNNYGDLKRMVAKSLYGMEIDERAGNKSVINSYSQANPEALQKAIKNSFNLILESCQSNDLDQITEIHDDVKKFCFFSLRLLHKGCYMQFNQALALSRIINALEEISNLLRHMVKHYGMKITELNLFLEEMCNAYFNVSKVDEFFVRSEKLKDYLNNSTLGKEIKENAFMVRYLAINLVRQTLIVSFKKN